MYKYAIILQKLTEFTAERSNLTNVQYHIQGRRGLDVQLIIISAHSGDAGERNDTYVFKKIFTFLKDFTLKHANYFL